MDNNYAEDYVEEEKKFKITRGMVILAVLALVVLIIIILIILNIIQSRKPEYTVDDFKYLETRMKEEASTYLLQKNKELTSEITKIKLDDLLIQAGGAIDPNKVVAAKVCEGYVYAYKNDTIVYEPYIKCGKYYTTDGYKEEKTVTKKKTTKVKDTEKPIITIIGEKEITIEKGSEYKDEGAKATDNIDGDITSKIKTSNKLEPNKVGEYKITYTVTDKAGNTAEDVRTVKVIEATTTTKTTTKKNTTKSTTKASYKTTTKPVITTTRRITTPPSIILSGNTYINISVGNWYQEPGYSARDALGNDITSRVSVSGSVNTNVAGTYTIKYSVTDAYGNYASKTRTVKVSSNYIALQGLTVTPNSVSLSVGKSITIIVGYIPSNATNKSISWSSENTRVATVSNGTIRAVSKGSTYVVVKGADNKSARITVVVK